MTCHIVSHSRRWHSCTFSFMLHYDFMDSDRDETLLYPVHALKKYLSQTHPYCPACPHLFISMGKCKKCAFCNTICFWLHLVIMRGTLPHLLGFRPRHMSSEGLVLHHSLRKMLQSNRCWGQVHGSLSPPSILSNWRTLSIRRWKPSPSTLWWLLNRLCSSWVGSVSVVASGYFLAVHDWVGSLGLIWYTVSFPLLPLRPKH